MTNKGKLIAAIHADGRIKYRVELPAERHVIEIKLADIQAHPVLASIRGKAIDTSLLRTSQQRTGNEPMYPPCLYAELQDGKVAYFVADGHQRIQAAKNNGATSIVAQVITRWESVDAAFRECVNIQSARYEMTDADMFSILRQNRMTVAEVAALTGKADNTVQKMKHVCEHDVMIKMIEDGVFTTNIASGLVVKTNKNPEKMRALLNSLKAIYEKRKAEAKHWEDKLRTMKTNDKDLKAKGKVATYFKNFPWKQWEDALERDDGVVFDNGSASLKLDPPADDEQGSLTVGELASDWEKEIPIYFSSTKEHAKIPLAHLQDFLEKLPLVEKNVKAIIARRKLVMAKSVIPMHSANPTVNIDAPPAPEAQKPEMKVE